MNRDRLTTARRSWNMSRIRGKHTAPELMVRSLLHRMGYRFRLHVRIRVDAEDRGSKIEDRAIRSKRKSARYHPSSIVYPLPRYVRPDIVLAKYKTAIFVHGW